MLECISNIIDAVKPIIHCIASDTDAYFNTNLPFETLVAVVKMGWYCGLECIKLLRDYADFIVTIV